MHQLKGKDEGQMVKWEWKSRTALALLGRESLTLAILLARVCSE
jgi:hypothetical protein